MSGMMNGECDEIYIGERLIYVTWNTTYGNAAYVRENFRHMESVHVYSRVLAINWG